MRHLLKLSLVGVGGELQIELLTKGAAAVVGKLARSAALLAAGGCAMLLVAQRSLSTPVRELRRRTVSLTGEQQLSDGSTVPLDAARLAAPMERALQTCAVAMVLLATALVLARL
jgi:ferric-dicitrate binding protein FerR (iron transport regulator)